MNPTPTVLSFRFPLGRYHATPWNHSVNEARVEWPPSPWRLLRALLAVWHQRAPELDESAVHSLIHKLASSPPRYALPNSAPGHSRHYMPGVELDDREREKRFLAFDPFLALPREAQPDGPGALLVAWDVELTEEHTKTLTVLTQRMPYLGRADSICVAELLPTPPKRDTWITPTGSGGDLRLLTPTPETTLDQLELDTRTMRKKRMIDPPGAVWTSYTTPPKHEPARPRSRRQRARPTAVRFALDSPAPIHRTDTLLVTDALRRACLSQYGRRHPGPDGQRGQCPPLSGKSPTHTPSQQQHQHAHYLAGTADGDSPYLDTAIIWLPTGIDPDVLEAVTALRYLRLNPTRGTSSRRPADIAVALEHVGTITDAAPDWAPTETATTWSTLTPVCFRRHRKKEPLEDFITHQLAHELAHELHLDPDQTLHTVHPTTGEWPDHMPDTWARGFRRHRPTQTMNQRLPGLGLTLELTTEAAHHLTHRPLALGAHRHFGLGLFTPTP